MRLYCTRLLLNSAAFSALCQHKALLSVPRKELFPCRLSWAVELRYRIFFSGIDQFDVEDLFICIEFYFFSKNDFASQTSIVCAWVRFHWVYGNGFELVTDSIIHAIAFGQKEQDITYPKLGLIALDLESQSLAIVGGVDEDQFLNRIIR